jgi:hypothetical protein
MPGGKTAITFNQYLCRRGYNYMSTGEVMLRMIKKSFSEKSFCRFWRMWNPFTGYLFFLLYSFLIGNLKHPYSIFIVFTISGMVFHDFLILLFTGSVSIIFTITFTLYSIIFSIEEQMAARRKRRFLHQKRTRPIPIYYFVLLNMILLSVPLFLGILVNYYVFPDSLINNLFR